MTFTPENLLQMYAEGSLSAEAQKEFDKLFQKDPLFSERVTGALKDRLGSVPEGWVEKASSSLNQKRDSLWSAHEAQKAQSLLRMGQWFFILTVCGGLYLGAKWISTRENSAAAPALSTSLDSSLSGDSPMAPLEPPGSPVNGKKRGKTSTVPVDSQATGNKTDSDGLPDSPSRKSLNAREPVPASPGSPPGAVNDSSPAGIASSLAVGNKVKVSIASLTTDHVKIKVISSTGDLIQNLYEGPWNPSRTVTWNGEDLAGQKVLAGDYFVVIQTATKTVSNKVSIKP